MMIRHSAQVRQPPQWKPARHQRERQAQIMHARCMHARWRWKPFSSPIQAELQIHLLRYDAINGNLVGINQTPTSATRA